MFSISLTLRDCKNIYRILKRQFPLSVNMFDVQLELDNTCSINFYNCEKVADIFYNAEIYETASLLYRKLVDANNIIWQEQYIDCNQKLADCLFRQLKMDIEVMKEEIEELLLRVYNYYDKTNGSDHIQTVNTVIKLAFYYQYVGDLSKSQSYYDKIIKIKHPEMDYTTLVINMFGLGNKLFASGDRTQFKVYNFYAYRMILDHNIQLCLTNYICQQVRNAMGFL